MFRVVLSGIVLASATLAAHGQGPPNGEYSLTVQPAKEPSPALKYQLAFELRDQTPGNATVHYLRASLVNRDRWGRLSIKKRREEQQLRDKWLLMPIAEWPRAEVHAQFDQYKIVYDLIERAARSQRCNWEAENSLRQEGFDAMMPEIQNLRELTELVRFKIRLDLADGKLDEAAHWIRVGLTMARHAGEGPTMINVLVGLALTGIMNGELMRFVQQPGAPNMYWALTDLPHPFIDMRKGFQGERLAVEGVFPGLREMARDLKAGPMTAEQVGELANKLVKLAHPNTAEEENDRRLGILNMAGRLHEDAKKMLAEEGRDAEVIEKMPSLQAAMLLQLHQYDRAIDDMIKLQGVPYYEAAPLLRELDKRFKTEQAKAGGPGLTTIASLLVPACDKVRAAHVRVERQITALRCAEAVRLYAASHAGKPPAKLEDMKETPIPLDPYTGKPFVYKAEGNTAIIEGPAPDGEKRWIQNYIRFEVTLKK
jgi:hypothetical protein